MRNGPMYLLAATIFALAAAGATITRPHIPELTDVHQELQAECIAIMLDAKPKKEWRYLAVEYAKDPGLCRRVMSLPTKTILPMRGGDWRDRLDAGRSAVQ